MKTFSHVSVATSERRAPRYRQSAFDWSGEHLHRFLIHGAAYGIPYLGGIEFREDARRVPLSRFRLHCGERFRYEYDFTAGWKLDIRLERALPCDLKRALPSCIGEGRAAHLPIDELNIMECISKRGLANEVNGLSFLCPRWKSLKTEGRKWAPHTLFRAEPSESAPPF